jgi:predicted alpha/beta hydrolase family esterase
MKNAIILHGRPRKADYYNPEFQSQSNSHWLPWLTQHLLVQNISAVTPEIPHSYEPIWERWTKEVERYEIGPQTIIVGHSCGGGFWVRWLSEHKDIKVGKVVLVAPWVDVEQEDPNDFFKFELDEDLAARTQGLTLFHSIDDDPDIVSSVKELRNRMKNMKYVEFNDRGHFTHHYMPDDTFPELLEECLAGNS